MNESHRIVTNKYDKYRSTALEVAFNMLSKEEQTHIKLKRIETLERAIASQWEYHPNRNDGAEWSWEGAPSYSFRHPKSFDLAIWSTGQLCGLSIGTPTYGGDKMRLDIIERSPCHNLLKGKVTPIAINAFIVYAEAIGAKQLRIMRPLNEQLIKYYQGFGFTLAQGKNSNVPTHLWQNL